jgi:hypothetical protein
MTVVRASFRGTEAQPALLFLCVFLSAISAIATLRIAGPVFRMTRDRVPGLARIVVSAANALSSELGHPVAASQEASRVVHDAIRNGGNRFVR